MSAATCHQDTINDTSAGTSPNDSKNSIEPETAFLANAITNTIIPRSTTTCRDTLRASTPIESASVTNDIPSLINLIKKCDPERPTPQATSLKAEAHSDMNSLVRSITKIISSHMGTMTQCRGKNGDMIRDTGVIPYLLKWLRILVLHDTLPPSKNVDVSSSSSFAQESILVTLGALRDLACGSSPNRLQIWNADASTPGNNPTDNNVSLLLHLLRRYRGRSDGPSSWKDVTTFPQYKIELKCLTNTLGVLRNITHSCSRECGIMFHDLGGTADLVDLLLLKSGTIDGGDGTAPVLPDPSCPGREACYRAAGSLINLCEKTPDICDYLAGLDNSLVGLLVQCWGGNQVFMNAAKNRNETKKIRKLPLLHLGLVNLLKSLEKIGCLSQNCRDILNMEERRKAFAQRREEERKIRNKKGVLAVQKECTKEDKEQTPKSEVDLVKLR